MLEYKTLIETYYKEWKLPKLYAQLLNITPNYLNSICKEVYNQSANEFIKDRVILEAKRLLSHSDESVTQIAYELGYEDNSHFGKYFKSVVHVSPEKFRPKLSKKSTPMNYQLKNILVPTDFSACANNALRVAIGMAKRHNATIHLLHVVETAYIGVAADPLLIVNPSYTDFIKNANKNLEAQKEKISNLFDIPIKTIAQQGNITYQGSSVY